MKGSEMAGQIGVEAERAYRAWADRRDELKRIPGVVAVVVMTNLEKTEFGLTAYVLSEHSQVPNNVDGVPVRIEELPDFWLEINLSYDELEGHLAFLQAMSLITGYGSNVHKYFKLHLEVCEQCRTMVANLKKSYRSKFQA